MLLSENIDLFLVMIILTTISSTLHLGMSSIEIFYNLILEKYTFSHYSFKYAVILEF